MSSLMASERPRIAALDGLRAVAVLLVLAFHAGVTRFDGGFVGVDVFFVLSGFVITRKLLLEEAASGRIGLWRFWAGRSARLVPAAVVVIVATAVAFSLVSTPIERTDVRGDGVASLLYIANWRFVWEATQYFQDSVEASPYLHMWSLSVEEQFYVIWPLVLVGLSSVRVVQRSLTKSITVLAVVAIAWSVVAREVVSFERLYYGTDTRAYQLLVGAAAAAWLADGSGRIAGVAGRVMRRVGPALALAGLSMVLVASVAGPLDATERGWLAAAGSIALICPLAAGRGGVVGSVLRWKPVVGIGDVSYGMYLWHWPIVVIASEIWVIGAVTLFALSFGLSFVLAYTSRHLLEVPVMHWARRSLRTPRRSAGAVAGSVTSLVVVSVVVLPMALSADVPRLEVRSSGLSRDADAPVLLTRTPVPDDLGRIPVAPFAYGGACAGTSITVDSSCRSVDGDGPRVLLLGDSHADDLVPMITRAAESYGWDLHAVIVNGCPWQTGLRYVDFSSGLCDDAHSALEAGFVDRLDPDVILVASHPYLEPGYRVVAREPSEPPLEGLDLIADATRRSLDDLSESGRRIVIVEPRPSSPFDVLSCLSGASFVEECAFVAGPEAAAQGALYREIAEGAESVDTLELVDLVCPRYPICDAVVDGILVRVDRDHLSGGFVQTLGPEFARRAGLAPTSTG